MGSALCFAPLLQLFYTSFWLDSGYVLSCDTKTSDVSNAYEKIEAEKSGKVF